MGRKRKIHRDLPPGSWRVKDRDVVRWRATSGSVRAAALAVYGKDTIPLGSKHDVNACWVEYHRIQAKLREADSTTKPLGTVAELIADYRQHGLPRLSEKTRYERDRELKELEREFGFMRYAQSAHEATTGAFIRLMHVQRYLTANEARPVAANHAIKALAQVFAVAKRRGATEFCPVEGVEFHPEVPRKRRPADDLVAQVYAAASPRMQCMMDLAVACGLRRQDVLRIQVQDVKDDGLVITNWKTLAKVRTKAQQDFEAGRRESPDLSAEEMAGYRRAYRWTAELRAVVDRALQLRAKTLRGKRKAAMTLFVTDEGGEVTISAFSSEWTRLKAGLGIRAGTYHFHDHRRVTHTRAVEAGHNPSDMLGHANEATTKRHYAADTKVLAPVKPIKKTG